MRGKIVIEGDGGLDLDFEAVEGLSEQLMAKVELFARVRQAEDETERAGFEALNALALVAGHVIVQRTGHDGQVFFEAVLMAQIRHLLRQRLGLADAWPDIEGEA